MELIVIALPFREKREQDIADCNRLARERGLNLGIEVKERIDALAQLGFNLLS